MIWKIKIGRYQLALKKLAGRPKKTIFLRIREYFSYLKMVFKDKRFSGNPLSRGIRRIVENKKTHQFFIINLILILLLTGIISPSISAFSHNEGVKIETTNLSAQIYKLTTEESLRWPLDQIKITQGYHRFHQAIDLAETIGSPVFPLTEGVVEETTFQRLGYGNYIIINHGSGFKSLYAHLSRIMVKKNQEVNKNTIIGFVGTTGWSTGPHLHLEVYDNGQPFNPLTILK